MQPGRAEENEQNIIDSSTGCGLDELRTCEPEQFKEPARSLATTQALQTRVRLPWSRLGALENRLRSHAPQLARDFDYRRAVEAWPPWICFASSGSWPGIPALRPGRQGGIHRFAGEPEPRRPCLPGCRCSHRTATDPQPGTAQWTDPEVRQAIGQQDRWYRWRAQVAWHAAWGEQAPVWDRKVAQLRAEVTGLVDAFVAHAAVSRRRSRSGPLTCTRRVPACRTCCRRTVTWSSSTRPWCGGSSPGPTWACGRPPPRQRSSPRCWAARAGGAATSRLSSAARRHGFEQAVLIVRNLLKQEVKRLFVTRGDRGEEQPLLPALRDLLARAAGKDGPSVADEDLAAFRRGIAALVPAGFTPQGSGELKILVAYPQAAADTQIEAYIEEQVNLPRTHRAHRVPRHRHRVDRRGPAAHLDERDRGAELREILRHWSDALATSSHRTSWPGGSGSAIDFRWLATTENDRIDDHAPAAVRDVERAGRATSARRSPPAASWSRCPGNGRCPWN